MRPYALLFIYRRRLRAQAVPELLAGLGVAIAVALVFAVVVANDSVVGSASQGRSRGRRSREPAAPRARPRRL